MPAIATLEELKAVEKQISELRIKFPEACLAITEFMKKNRGTGYKNICKLFTGESTPDALKKEKK